MLFHGGARGWSRFFKLLELGTDLYLSLSHDHLAFVTVGSNHCDILCTGASIGKDG